MSNQFNYKRIFYRRPLLTKENVRLWSITLAVALIMLLTVSRSVQWSMHLPSLLLASKIKKDYVAFLTAKNLSESNALLSKKPEETSLKFSKDDLAGFVKRKETSRFSARNVNRKKSAYQQQVEKMSQKEDFYRRYIAPQAGSIEPVTAALEGVPGIVGMVQNGRRERRLSFDAINPANVAGSAPNNPINIPEPEPIKFSSHNGNRNLFETTAIIDVNEVDIRYCFQKFTRYDPTFSGDVLVSFTIHPNGYVIPGSIKIIKSNIVDPRILQCIKQSIRRWKNFPRIALEDGSFTITRKYVF